MIVIIPEPEVTYGLFSISNEDLVMTFPSRLVRILGEFQIIVKNNKKIEVAAIQFFR